MIELNKLMTLTGALAAFSFNEQGELTEHLIAEGSKLNETALDLLGHVCVANTAIATMQARGWEAVSGQEGFYPIDGFSLIGLDWSAIANKRQGVVIANEDADYQAAFDMLGIEGGAA